MSRRVFATGLVLLGLSVAGLASVTREPAVAAVPEIVEITIDNFTFSPSPQTIPVGTTVRWVNRDDIPHTVAEKGLAFRSKPLDTGDTFEHRFDEAGEIDYFCTLHPHMTGKIIVTPR